jgi:protein-L-isoaspartate(D-aspartate) O-methyltransferase
LPVLRAFAVAAILALAVIPEVARAAVASAPLGDPYWELREKMVRVVAEEAADTAFATGREKLSEHVLQAMREVPRHEFVPDAYRDAAYEDRPLPIGHGQTISQPFIVALMTDLLKPEPDHVVLEVGTGSGYQAAVLSRLVASVYTIEIVEALGEQAAARLHRLGYRNVEVRVSDGYYGWKEHAPYDGIIVTAAATHIPLPLIRQLKPGGRMVIPVGMPFATQQLMLVEKQADGEVRTHQLLPVAFVPLTGSH